MSRNLNEAFSFSALQTTGRFVRFQGPANVALEGRIYHEIRDVMNHEGLPAHWFIYDNTARPGTDAEHRPPQETMHLVRQYLEHVNTFVNSFRSAADQVQDNTAPFAIELTVPPTGGDVAAKGDSSYHVENTKVISIKETGEHQDLLARTGIPSQWKPRTILIF